MATNVRLWLPVLVVFLGGSVGGRGAGLAAGATRAEALFPQALRAAYTGEIGVREATGNNDGPRVAEYLRYCGLGEGYEWCAAFVSWCHGQAGYPEPRNAWAAALFPVRKLIWERHGTGDAARNTRARAISYTIPRPGDVFGIYMASKKRIAHCGFVDQWEGEWCITVEGNVDHAVVRKRRLVRTIRVVARWVE